MSCTASISFTRKPGSPRGFVADVDGEVVRALLHLGDGELLKALDVFRVEQGLRAGEAGIEAFADEGEMGERHRQSNAMPFNRASTRAMVFSNTMVRRSNWRGINYSLCHATAASGKARTQRPQRLPLAYARPASPALT